MKLNTLKSSLYRQTKHLLLNSDSVHTTETSEGNSRYVLYLDILRLMAAFSVVMLHVSGMYSGDGMSEKWVSTSYSIVVQWVVPVFIMISGALFLNPQRHVSTEKIITQSIPRLLLTWLFWVLVYLAIAEVQHYRENGTLFYDVSRMFYFHLWFLPMLAAIYLLVPLLRKIATQRQMLVYALLIWFMCLCVSFFTARWNIPQVSSLFALNTVASNTGYFLLGYFVSACKISKRTRYLFYFLFIVCAVAATIGTMSLPAWNRRWNNANTPHTAIMAVALFVLAKQIAPKLKPWFSGILKHIRGDLFGVYLTHAIWLMVFGSWKALSGVSNFISIPVISLIVFTLSIATTKAIHMVPGLRKVVE